MASTPPSHQTLSRTSSLNEGNYKSWKKLRNRLKLFYETHNPDKLKNISAVAEKYLDRQQELCMRLERKYGSGSFFKFAPELKPNMKTSSPSSFATGADAILDEHAEPVASPGGACRRMSSAEYVEAGRIQTEEALKALVKDMKNDHGDMSRRLTRSHKRSLVTQAKALLGSLFKSEDSVAEQKKKEVNELAERIINTHYYYNGKLSDTKMKKNKENEGAKNKTTPKKKVVFKTKTPAGLQRPRPSFLSDILKPNMQKSLKPKKDSTSIKQTRPMNKVETPRRPNFLEELKKSNLKGLRKVEQTNSKSALKKAPITLLEEIKLRARQARRNTGLDRSPGLTPYKSKNPNNRSRLGPGEGLRNALEIALAERFKHIHRNEVASPAMSEMSDF